MCDTLNPNPNPELPRTTPSTKHTTKPPLSLTHHHLRPIDFVQLPPELDANGELDEYLSDEAIDNLTILAEALYNCQIGETRRTKPVTPLHKRQ